MAITRTVKTRRAYSTNSAPVSTITPSASQEVSYEPPKAPLKIKEWKMAEEDRYVATLGYPDGLPECKLYFHRLGHYEVRIDYDTGRGIVHGVIPINMAHDDERSKLKERVHSWLTEVDRPNSESLYNQVRRMGGHHKKHKRNKRHHHEPMGSRQSSSSPPNTTNTSRALWGFR